MIFIKQAIDYTITKLSSVIVSGVNNFSSNVIQKLGEITINIPILNYNLPFFKSLTSLSYLVISKYLLSLVNLNFAILFEKSLIVITTIGNFLWNITLPVFGKSIQGSIYMVALSMNIVQRPKYNLSLNYELLRSHQNAKGISFSEDYLGTFEIIKEQEGFFRNFMVRLVEYTIPNEFVATDAIIYIIIGTGLLATTIGLGYFLYNFKFGGSDNNNFSQPPKDNNEAININRVEIEAELPINNESIPVDIILPAILPEVLVDEIIAHPIEAVVNLEPAADLRRALVDEPNVVPENWALEMFNRLTEELNSIRREPLPILPNTEIPEVNIPQIAIEEVIPEQLIGINSEELAGWASLAFKSGTLFLNPSEAVLDIGEFWFEQQELKTSEKTIEASGVKLANNLPAINPFGTFEKPTVFIPGTTPLMELQNNLVAEKENNSGNSLGLAALAAGTLRLLKKIK